MDSMSRIESTIDVDVPISIAYDRWTRFEDFPDFLSAVTEVRQHGDALLHWTVTVGGVEREFDAEITSSTPTSGSRGRTIAGPRHAGVVTFHRLTAERTRVALQMDWEPEGFVETAGAILQIDDLQIARDLARFKDLVEEDGAARGWRGDIDRAPDATGR